MIMSLPTYFVLKNGTKIPSVGFGISSAAPLALNVALLTEFSRSSDTTRAAEEICEAIEIGYRQIDLAWKYNVSMALALIFYRSISGR